MAEPRDEHDGGLIRRVRAGEEEAFRAVFDRYAPAANALARRIVRQPFLAEEIVQEAFLALWRDPSAYDERRGSLRAWLLSMVHHRAVDVVRREEAHRRRADQRSVEVERAVEQDPAERIAEEVDRPRERAAVRAALDDLPTEQRDVLELMYFAGLSQSQVAARLEVPLGTVKSRTVLGMRRLRTALTADGP